MAACGSCIYFDGRNSVNYCRRRAPDAALTGNPKVVWPQVDPVNDWCADGYSTTDGWYDPSPASGTRVR